MEAAKCAAHRVLQGRQDERVLWCSLPSSPALGKGQGEEGVFRRKGSNSRVTSLHFPPPHSLCLFVQSGT